MVEALERLLVSRYLEKKRLHGQTAFTNLPAMSMDRVNALIKVPGKATQDSVLQDQYIQMSYVAHVWFTLLLHQAVKTNYLIVYTQYLCEMPNLLFKIMPPILHSFQCSW